MFTTVNDFTTFCKHLFYCCFYGKLFYMSKLKLTESAMIDLLGGNSKVARMCKVRPQAVIYWKQHGIPHGHLLFLAARLEKASHGLVTRQDLFPSSWMLVWPELLPKSNLFGKHDDSE
jgi:DNA-binding transcriptional regulator YdaS (Cro superfamily)